MFVGALALVDNVGAGGAHIARGARLSVAESRQKLHLHRNRPVLLFRHGSGVLGVEHHATVEPGELRGTNLQFSHETIL